MCHANVSYNGNGLCLVSHNACVWTGPPVLLNGHSWYVTTIYIYIIITMCGCYDTIIYSATLCHLLHSYQKVYVGKHKCRLSIIWEYIVVIWYIFLFSVSKSNQIKCIVLFIQDALAIHILRYLIYVVLHGWYAFCMVFHVRWIFLTMSLRKEGGIRRRVVRNPYKMHFLAYFTL